MFWQLLWVKWTNKESKTMTEQKKSQNCFVRAELITADQKKKHFVHWQQKEPVQYLSKRNLSEPRGAELVSVLYFPCGYRFSGFLKWRVTSSSQISWSGWNLILRFIIIISQFCSFFFCFIAQNCQSGSYVSQNLFHILLNIGNIMFAVFKKDLLAFKLIMSYLNSVIASLSPLSRMWTQLRRMLQQFCLAQG